jgi:ribosomal protein S18 acetylase RimI-like enzyme
MIIRRAKSDDREELKRLLIAFDEDTKNTLSPIQTKIRAYRDLSEMAEDRVNKYFSDPNYIVYVADDGTLRGYCSGEIQEKKLRVYDKPGYIENWFVEKNFQSHGVGKLMFDKLVKDFEKAGCTHIALDTNVENTKAIKIYEHMGFTKRLVTFFKPLKDLK